MNTSNEGRAQVKKEHQSNGLKSAPSEKTTITSLEIAEISGKLHKNVMSSIRSQEVAWEKVNGLKFKLVDYKDGKGEIRPMYELSKMESLYISSKFNDEVRARLVIRWHDLETAKKSRGVKLYDHELPLFEILKKHLVLGDIKKVAASLDVTPGHVSRVKRGSCRSHRVMDALMDKAKHNYDSGITDGYNLNYAQLKLDLFNPQQNLSL